ncbi:3'(2'),5'-bisphosphate nucleotidase CysQ [Candidatus Poriferisodalis sp.]|uniref:3'(2'),5'-bisphosphate nucleotidase CysQ n=1 Tax=Candidatus Poriferisodalis sp. TaxID=3101277 RepID=UPI003B02913C
MNVVEPALDGQTGLMAQSCDHALAASVATEAGAMLVEIRERMFNAGAGTWEVRDTGDMEAHRLIMNRLSEARPGDAILSEEGRDDHGRLSAERVWIVDPLDGTREYSEPGRSDWAVHVALVEGGIPTAGAVALPAVGQTLCTDPEPSLPAASGGRPRIVVSRSRPPAAAIIVAQALDAELMTLGSAGAKAMAVVLGMADIYAHSGGQYEWDNCAPVAVARAAGLHASRCDGSELEYNFADPWLPDVLICRREFAADSLEALRKVIEGEA